jgi:hypothetical protein
MKQYVRSHSICCHHLVAICNLSPSFEIVDHTPDLRQELAYLILGLYSQPLSLTIPPLDIWPPLVYILLSSQEPRCV